MQANSIFFNNLRQHLSTARDKLGFWPDLILWFIISFIGWDLLAWVVTCAWTHDWSSAPWASGGWWGWCSGIASLTLQLLLTVVSAYWVLGVLFFSPLSQTSDSPSVMLLILFAFLTVILGVAAFLLSSFISITDWLLAAGWAWMTSLF